MEQKSILIIYQSGSMWKAAEENGQLLTVQVRKLYQPESSNNSSDSEGDDFQGPRRKKAERGPQRGGK